MATRDDVLDRVTDLLEDKSTTTRTRVEPWVRFVMQEMKQAGVLGPDASTTIATVAATATYDLPADLDHLDSVYIEDDAGEPLTFVPEEQFAAHLADDDDFAGTPSEYTLPIRPGASSSATALDAPTIRLWPVPDAIKTLRVNYKANFRALTADTHVLELADDAFTTCVWGVYRIWTRIEERDDVQSATEEFRLGVARAKQKQFGTVGRTYATRYRDV